MRIFEIVKNQNLQSKGIDLFIFKNARAILNEKVFGYRKLELPKYLI